MSNQIIKFVAKFESVLAGAVVTPIVFFGIKAPLNLLAPWVRRILHVILGLRQSSQLG